MTKNTFKIYFYNLFWVILIIFTHQNIPDTRTKTPAPSRFSGCCPSFPRDAPPEAPSAFPCGNTDGIWGFETFF